MPDIYQLDTYGPIDVNRINFILRDLYKRISELSGRAGDVTVTTDMRMSGKKILDGPTQTTADPTEFITKGYLSSQEAAETMRSNLSPTGKAPLKPEPTP